MGSSLSRKKGFLPWKLHGATIGAGFVINAALMAGIIALLVISETRSGFITVQSSSTLSPSIQTLLSSRTADKSWALSLSWTTLPSFIMALYGLCWAAITSEAQDRQPFLELAKQGGSTGKKSVLLDYRQDWAAIRPLKAFGNGHVMLGVAMILALIIQLALVPLSSHLIVPSGTNSAQTRAMFITTAFNESGFTSRTDIGFVLNLVSATRNLGASDPPWTRDDFAFPKFSITSATPQGTTLSANVTALSSSLDCTNVAVYQTSAQDSGTGKAVEFSATDRGCDIADTLFVDKGGATEYVSSTAVTSCKSRSTRLLLISGVYDETSLILLSSITVVSCIPSYWRTNGTLAIDDPDASSPTILSFYPLNDAYTFQWQSSQTFENGVHIPAAFDPTATVQATSFGLAVLTFARKALQSSPNSSPAPLSHIPGAAIVNATAEIFMSTFTITTASFLFPNSATPLPITGTSSELITRLFIVPYIAGIMLALMLLVGICCIIVGVKSARAPSILREEPKGLLGLALLLSKDPTPQAGDNMVPVAPPPVQNFFLSFVLKFGKELGGYQAPPTSFNGFVKSQSIETTRFDTTELNDGGIVVLNP